MRRSGNLPEPSRLSYAPATRPHDVLADCASRSKSSGRLQAIPGRCVVASVSDASEIRSYSRPHLTGRPPNFAPSCKSGVSSDGQFGDKYLAFSLRAQQHRDKENGQAHNRGDETRTRKADQEGGRV